MCFPVFSPFHKGQTEHSSPSTENAEAYAQHFCLQKPIRDAAPNIFFGGRGTGHIGTSSETFLTKVLEKLEACNKTKNPL